MIVPVFVSADFQNLLHPTAIGRPRDVHDDVHGFPDERFDRFRVVLTHADEEGQSRQGTPCIIGVEGRDASVMAGVPGHEEIEGFRPAHFTHENAVGSHA